jgi:hypothetical protein
MAQQAEDDGIVKVCATPHVRHDHDVVIGELNRRVAALNTELRRRGVETRVTTGAEVAGTALSGLDDQELRLASLGGGGRWILLEPAPGPLGDSIDAGVETRRALRPPRSSPGRTSTFRSRRRLAEPASAGRDELVLGRHPLGGGLKLGRAGHDHDRAGSRPHQLR